MLHYHRRNPSLLVLDGTVPCPMHTPTGIHKVILPFPSSFQIFIGSSALEKVGVLLCKFYLVKDTRVSAKGWNLFTQCLTAEDAHNWQFYTIFWHTRNRTVRSPLPLSLSRRVNENQFICCDCQSITTLALSKYQTLCSRDCA